MIKEADLGKLRAIWIEELMCKARLNPLFTQWESHQAEVVKIVPSTAMAEIAGEIEEWVTSYRPVVKKCWENAYQLALGLVDNGVDIVHGYRLIHGGMFKHAWNAYKGVHFDITAETNNVGMETSIRASDLEAGRKRFQRYVKISTFTVNDYLSIADECDWPEHFTQYYVSNWEKRPYRVKYMSKALALQLNRKAGKRGYPEGLDESVLQSLPTSFKCLIAFATYYRDHVRAGVVLSRLPRTGGCLQESGLGIFHIEKDAYASLPYVAKRKRGFMQMTD